VLRSNSRLKTQNAKRKTQFSRSQRSQNSQRIKPCQPVQRNQSIQCSQRSGTMLQSRYAIVARKLKLESGIWNQSILTPVSCLQTPDSPCLATAQPELPAPCSPLPASITPHPPNPCSKTGIESHILHFPLPTIHYQLSIIRYQQSIILPNRVDRGKYR